MKKLFFIAALTAVSFSGFSQDDESTKPLSFSVGVEGALPIGDFGDGYSFGIGGSVQGDYMVAPSFAITLNVGYLSYSGKSFDFGGISFKNPSLGVMPVLAGAKYWFSPMFYGHAQFGMSFMNNGGGSAFTYAPGIGVKFSQIDVAVKYVGMSKDGSSLNNIGLRAAYNF